MHINKLQVNINYYIQALTEQHSGRIDSRQAPPTIQIDTTLILFIIKVTRQDCIMPIDLALFPSMKYYIIVIIIR